jgi:hypothetical protein
MFCILVCVFIFFYHIHHLRLLKKYTVFCLYQPCKDLIIELIILDFTVLLNKHIRYVEIEQVYRK